MFLSLAFLNWGSHGFITLENISIHLTIVFCVFLSIVAFPFIFKSKNITKCKLPPGPTPWPIVGSLPKLWRNKPAFRWILGLMKELNTEIACIRLGNVHVIPVTSPEIAREFLKKHDSLFSSRPLTMAAEYISRGFLSTAIVPFGEQWKKMKKVVASNIMNQARLRWLLNKRNEEADNLVRFVYNQCKNSCGSSIVDVRLVARQYCGNVIRKIIFNKRYFGKGRKDGGPGVEEVEYVESMMTLLGHLYTFAVSDYMPSLRLLDIDGHEKIVSEALKTVTCYEDPIVDDRVQQWREGIKKEPEDLLDAFISAKDSNGNSTLSVKEIKAQITELVIATVDNPSNCIEWALAEMLNQPELLHKAVEEIDRVVGKERWVQEYDISQLNYVKACAREAYRLHPVAPFNVPHVSMEDITVAGYFIPKGSHVILSRYGLGRNARVWKEPLKFIPERHLRDGFDVSLEENDLRFISFSTGRRGCIGVTLGSIITTMLLARLLQGFSWSLPPNVKKIDLSESKNDLFMAKPLHALAKPRLAAGLYPVAD